MAELSTIQTASKFNQVYHLQKPDYSRDVTDVSKEAWVLVLLTAASTNTESQRAVELWRELARKFGDIKFCQIRGTMCIEGYPDKNTPTVLIYKDGDIKRQIVTLKELNGPRTSVEGEILRENAGLKLLMSLGASCSVIGATALIFTVLFANDIVSQISRSC